MSTTPEDRDDLDWDVDRDGRMADFATDEEHEPESVPFLQGVDRDAPQD
jgi:hypothetical protein